VDSLAQASRIQRIPATTWFSPSWIRHINLRNQLDFRHANGKPISTFRRYLLCTKQLPRRLDHFSRFQDPASSVLAWTEESCT
jgi:hypothetical protein